MTIKPLQQHGDKILFGLANLYFLLVLSWLINQDYLKLPFIENKNGETTVKSLSASDKAFIAYLQARLAMIDASRPSEPVAENPPKTPNIQTNLPSVAISPPPTPPKPTTPSIIERVYIPLYPETPQVSQPTASAPPQQAVIPPPPTPSTPRLQSVPILNPNNSTPQTTARQTPPKSLLVGALASGDRSYAIFQVNGKPKQVRIGEIIDQSGWVLVNVENQQITLRKRGRQRIISVGDEL